MHYEGWIFLRTQYFSGVTIFRSEYFLGWIFFRVNIFQVWIFFTGEYFSRVNIFQRQLVFKEEYFSRVIFVKGWTFFRYTHSMNIWLSHNLLGLVISKNEVFSLGNINVLHFLQGWFHGWRILRRLLWRSSILLKFFFWCKMSTFFLFLFFLFPELDECVSIEKDGFTPY